ncbi:MAG: response regulator [Vicinamibacterales bacterium]
MPTVLIVEDDPDIRMLERHALEGGGYDVAMATNGLEGLQRLRGGAVPCLILLDLMMPVMDGLSFLAERRKSHVCEEVPVVCVTAGGPELMARARELGAIACVDKPTDFEDLCDVVRQYCGR